MRSGLSGVFVGATLLATAAGPAQADVSVFLSSPRWEFALPENTSELVTFDEFTSDVAFEDAPLDVGPFTLRTDVAEPFDTGISNRIDAAPFADDSINNGVPVNGTPYARVGVNNDLFDRGDTTVSIVFDEPILAWGADFTAAATRELLDLALFTDPNEPPVLVPVTVNAGFFGFVLDATDAGVTEVQFRSRLTLDGTEFFGLDNVRFASIPEPAGLALMGIFTVAAARTGRRSLARG
ncbi:MAG: hypothetical protein AAGE65_14650 [Planctomycetota bacterium]